MTPTPKFCASLAMVSTLLFSGAGQAAEKIALIVDVVGQTNPAVEPFSELDTGATVELAKGAEIILMHYRTCEETHVESGVVTVGPTNLQVSGGGNVVASDKVQCPETVAFVEGSNAAGAVVLRSASDAVMAIRPVFFAPGASAIDVMLDDEVVASVTIRNGRGLWPARAPDLTAGQSYLLHIKDADGDKIAAATARGNAGVVILREK